MRPPEQPNIRVATPRSKSSALVATSITAMVVATVLLAVAALYSAASESDSVSVERQARWASHAIDISIDELALQQETVAIWDDAASHLVASRLDETWIHDNIGGWLYRIFRHDEVLILDGFDRPIYAAIEGERVPIDRFRSLSSEVKPLIDGVRGRMFHRGRHSRLPGQPLVSPSTVRTTPRAVHVSQIGLVAGRPAALSAMLMQSSTPNYVRPKGSWPVLVSVRYLDAGFLSELSARQLIASPRFANSPGIWRGEHATELRREDGGRIGYLVWKPEFPGSKVLAKLLPWNLMVLVSLITFIALLGVRLRRTVGAVVNAEREVAHLAFHDSLTGLPNRALFQQKLDELTSHPEGSEAHFALALLDLDDFKLTNDTMGHDAGDALLKTVADRLLQSTRKGDLVARLGGDEFAVLLSGLDSRAELEGMAGQLLERLRQPCDHQGKQIDCQVSIGATIYEVGDNGQEMLKQADLALYESKTSGRGVYRLYAPRMWSSMLSRQRKLWRAKEALEQGLIRPFYQPKVNLKTGQIVGFEALLRCCSPGRSPLGPNHIDAAFEDSALAIQLSQTMIEQVIDDVARWRAAGLPFGHVAINASAAELRHGDYASRLLTKLTSAGVPADSIQVEVTEGVLLGRGVDHVHRAFRELAKNGLKLALDDFGTGFASLSHLKQFPVAIIKIDRTFVRDLQIDPEDGAIVDALIGLARALHIDVVAEGIETSAQRDFLAALGCSTGQGFLFSRAVPAKQVPDMLRRQQKIRLQAA